MIVDSDTSPLRALNHLGLSSLPHSLFGEVLVPPAVEQELIHPAPRFARIDPTAIPGLRVQVPNSTAMVQQLRQQLDPGESEAIALAIEQSADVILIDEAAGRAEAARRGLAITGTLGVLLRGKQTGQIVEIAPLLDELQNSLGFYLSDAVRARILQVAGE